MMSCFWYDVTYWKLPRFILLGYNVTVSKEDMEIILILSVISQISEAHY